MNRSRFFILNSVFIAALSLQTSFAQDYIRWGLPEGAKLRLGKGTVSGNIAFSPDGSLLAVASSIGIWLYDANTGAEVNLLTGHRAVVKSIAFSPDGFTLASGSWDTTIRLWDVPAGKLLNTLAGHEESINSIAFSPDGSTLASKSRDNTTRLWDFPTGEPVKSLERHQHWLIPFRLNNSAYNVSIYRSPVLLLAGHLATPTFRGEKVSCYASFFT